MFCTAEISAATAAVGSVHHKPRSTHSTSRRAYNSPTANNRNAIDVDSSRVASPITSSRPTSDSSNILATLNRTPDRSHTSIQGGVY
jgi:hypothetical protein